MIEHLITQAPDGRASVRAGLNELKEFGYIVSSRNQSDKGLFDGWETIVLEEPEDTEVRLSNVGDAPKFDNPTSDKPSDGKSNTNEQRTLMNNEKTNDVRKDSEKRIDAWFAEIWKHYPRKEGKSSARKAAVARVKSGVLVSTLLTATKNYEVERFAEDEKFTMLPSTFFGPDLRYEKYATRIGAHEEEMRAIQQRESEREFEERRKRENAASVPMPDSMKEMKKKLRGNL